MKVPKQILIYLVAWLLMSGFIISAPSAFRGQTTGEPQLEVAWISINAQLIDGSAYLEWITAEEEESDYFIVERSLDGLTFNQVGKVKASGTSIDMSYYNFLDLDVIETSSPIIYYRVKLVDTQGNFGQSERLELLRHQKLGLGVKIFPNPAKDQLNLIYESQDIHPLTIRITSINGRNMYEKVLAPGTGLQEYSIAVGKWPEGIYYVKLFNQKHSVVEQVWITP
ncbi:MAG: T9SS type A sorting domain-containing protein [Bacteroidota bacterium]